MFRIAVIVAGMVSIFLGYRLFVRGVMPQETTEAGVEVQHVKLTLKNAAPGTCFAFFGVVIIAVMIVKGTPELLLEEVATNAAAFDAARNSSDTPNTHSDTDRRVIRTQLKGKVDAAIQDDAVALFDYYFKKGLHLDRDGDVEGARAAYAEALAESEIPLRYSAAALNQVALGYLAQKRFDEAVAIARIAVLAEPEFPAYHDTLAQIYLAQNEIGRAIQHAKISVSLDPNVEEHQRTLTIAMKRSE